MNRKMLFSNPNRSNGPTLGLTLTAFMACAAAVASAQEAKTTPIASVGMVLPSALSGATLVSHVSPSTVLSMSLSIAPTNPAGLESFARAVSNPQDANYRRFLTPAQIGQRFGASDTTVNTAVSFLKSKGMTIDLVADNHMAILFHGKVSSVESAFSTKINRYHAPSRPTPGPTDFFSYASVPKVPSSFASKVVSLQGLDSANPPVPRTSTLRPQDGRTAYSLTPLYAGALGNHKGQGIKIGVSNFDGYRLSNLPIFVSTYGLPTPSGGVGSNVHKVVVGGVDGETATPGAEGDLDFQMVIGMAPLSDVYIYDGIGGGLISVLTKEAQDNIVDIITESYGFRNSDDFYQAAHNQHVAMTAQGITYMGASGDNGTADQINDPYPDFDPDVLEVGGSDITVDGSGSRVTELGWDGSGSGWYQGNIGFNVLPPYQVGVGIPTTINRRLIPDMAVHAISWNIAFNGAITQIGGTSASTPSFAGQLGVILQTLAENGAADLAPNGRPRVGRIQDFIYTLNGDATSFLDLTSVDGTGNAGPLPNGTLSVCTAGWDFVTGLGAPNDAGLYAAFLANGSTTATDSAGAPVIYSNSVMPSGFGTSATGGATELPDADGISYTVQSVKQKGVGQVAAVTIPVSLQTAKQRRAASVKVVMSAPSLTTGTIYLLNKNTNVFDLVKTVPNTGTMTTTTVTLDLTASTYISGNTVTMLVRGLKPSRLGASPFTLTIDQAVVVEKVARG